MNRKIRIYSIAFGLLLCICACHKGFAQEIVFSRSIDGGGNPEVVSKAWMLPEKNVNGIEVMATFAPSEPLKGKKGYFFIDKELPLGGFDEHANHKVWVDSSGQVHKVLPFKDAGKYVVMYANERKEILSRDTITVHATNDVFFCVDKKGGKPVDISRKFYPSKSGLYQYYICARSTKPFDTHQLITEIYRYKVGDYREPISTATDYVNHEWRTVFFLGSMLEPGQYRLMIKKANGEPFAVGYFELMSKEEQP